MCIVRFACHNKAYGVHVIYSAKETIRGVFREADAQRCSVKKVLLKILQKSQENTCAIVSILTKKLWHRCFSVNFEKLLTTPFLQIISGRLLLKTFYWVVYFSNTVKKLIKLKGMKQKI